VNRSDADRVVLELLATSAAMNLAGRQDVTVKLKQPANMKFWGVCYRKGAGVCIDVRPDLEDKQLLEVLLHEISHARNDAKDMVDSSQSILARLAVSTNDTPAHAWREERANSEADSWLEYATGHAFTLPGQLYALAVKK